MYIASALYILFSGFLYFTLNICVFINFKYIFFLNHSYLYNCLNIYMIFKYILLSIVGAVVA